MQIVLFQVIIGNVSYDSEKKELFLTIETFRIRVRERARPIRENATPDRERRRPIMERMEQVR